MTPEKVTQEAPLHYGDNGSQEFYEGTDRATLLIRNSQEQPWICVLLAGKMSPVDKARQRRAKPGSWYSLQAKTAFSLALRIKQQYGIQLRFDPSRTWQKGKGERMVLRGNRA